MLRYFLQYHWLLASGCDRPVVANVDCLHAFEAYWQCAPSSQPPVSPFEAIKIPPLHPFVPFTSSPLYPQPPSSLDETYPCTLPLLPHPICYNAHAFWLFYVLGYSRILCLA